VGGVLVAETQLFELARFLERHYARDRRGTVLDLGAGSRPYRDLYVRFFERAISADVLTSPHDVREVDVAASAESLPFEDRSFDAVICTEVLEHCRNPAQAVREVARILRPGGRAFITTPFLVQLHEMPHDFFRYTPCALTGLAADAGLEVTSVVTRGDYLALMLTLLAFPVSKLFQKLSTTLRINLHRPENPIVYLALVLPQRLYFARWRRMRMGGAPLFRRIHERLNYFALGYVLVVCRPAAGEAVPVWT
jgi:SAM-dependent methyltransferase